MDRYVCIHGHFYQPPRENPWLEEIELQDSAHPYHDWNERISAECYAPNAASRILDAESRIVGIVNNYAGISFNFGPTLLSWLERREPNVYRAILDADRESLKRFEGGGDLPRTHLASPEHLAVFPDRAFDYVISLHVVHHIQPFDVAVGALAEMLRIARRGVFVIDLENKPGAVPFTRIWNRLMGVSRALSSDGVKSIRRAHDPRRLRDALSERDGAKDYRVELKRYPVVPYWRLQARRLRR